MDKDTASSSLSVTVIISKKKKKVDILPAGMDA